MDDERTVRFLNGNHLDEPSPRIEPYRYNLSLVRGASKLHRDIVAPCLLDIVCVQPMFERVFVNVRFIHYMP